jgi:hypothetical protein
VFILLNTTPLITAAMTAAKKATKNVFMDGFLQCETDAITNRTRKRSCELRPINPSNTRLRLLLRASRNGENGREADRRASGRPGALPFDYFKAEGKTWMTVPPAAQKAFPAIDEIMQKKVVRSPLNYSK